MNYLPTTGSSSSSEKVRFLAASSAMLAGTCGLRHCFMCWRHQILSRCLPQQRDFPQMCSRLFWVAVFSLFLVAFRLYPAQYHHVFIANGTRAYTDSGRFSTMASKQNILDKDHGFMRSIIKNQVDRWGLQLVRVVRPESADCGGSLPCCSSLLIWGGLLGRLMPLRLRLRVTLST